MTWRWNLRTLLTEMIYRCEQLCINVSFSRSQESLQYIFSPQFFFVASTFTSSLLFIRYNDLYTRSPPFLFLITYSKYYCPFSFHFLLLLSFLFFFLFMFIDSDLSTITSWKQVFFVRRGLLRCHNLADV